SLRKLGGLRFLRRRFGALHSRLWRLRQNPRPTFHWDGRGSRTHPYHTARRAQSEPKRCVARGGQCWRRPIGPPLTGLKPRKQIGRRATGTAGDREQAAATTPER